MSERGAAAAARTGDRGSERVARAVLEVDPTRCDGVGMCAYLAAGIVHLDRWGFPLVPEPSADPAVRRALDRAVVGCPRRALAVRES